MNPLMDDTIIACKYSPVIGKSVPILCQIYAIKVKQALPEENACHKDYYKPYPVSETTILHAVVTI